MAPFIAFLCLNKSRNATHNRLGKNETTFRSYCDTIMVQRPRTTTELISVTQIHRCTESHRATVPPLHDINVRAYKFSFVIDGTR